MDYKTPIEMQQLIDTLRTLVRMDTVQKPAVGDAPFGLELKQALDYVLGLAQSWGWRTCNLNYKCGWAEVGDGPLFGVLCHIDTVPLGEGWRFDPLSATIADGKMYGRGTQDDKGPLVASMYALKALLDEGKMPKMRIRFIVGCNEETGWECMDRYLATEELPVMAISPDGDFPVINCEKGLGHYELAVPAPQWLVSLDSGTRVNVVPDSAQGEVSLWNDDAQAAAQEGGVCVEKKGAGYTLAATGRNAHGSRPWLGDNALLKVLAALSRLGEPFATLYACLDDCHGAHCGVGFSDEPSGELSMNVGYAHLEDGMVKIGLDIRFPISYTNADVQKGLQRALPFASITLVHDHPALYVAADHPLVVGLLDAYQEVMGERPAPLCVGGATYARALPNAVAFGPVFPGDDEMCHQVDEYVSLERLEQMAAIYRLAFDKLCF